jgi:hypothetical protein
MAFNRGETVRHIETNKELVVTGRTEEGFLAVTREDGTTVEVEEKLLDYPLADEDKERIREFETDLHNAYIAVIGIRLSMRHFPTLFRAYDKRVRTLKEIVEDII